LLAPVARPRRFVAVVVTRATIVAAIAIRPAGRIKILSPARPPRLSALRAALPFFVRVAANARGFLWARAFPVLHGNLLEAAAVMPLIPPEPAGWRDVPAGGEKTGARRPVCL
jgi:hypothetical protein